MNHTDWGNDTDFSNYEEFYQRINTAVHISESIIIVFGIVLNVWLLSAIVTSSETRSSLRNKMIANICVLHLTECVFKSPILLAIHNVYLQSCSLITAYIDVYLIQEFISNWIQVVMITLYVCQIMDLKIFHTLSLMGQRVLTVCVLLLPWVVSLITVPAMVRSSESNFFDCFFPSSYVLSASVNTMLPVFLSIILLAVAVVKRRNRCTEDHSNSSTQAQLIIESFESDNHWPYVAAVGVSVLCDTGRVLAEIPQVNVQIATHYAIMILADTRCIFMVLPWLLFNDIRNRMRTWRPWHRSLPGTDVTLTYQKSQDKQ